MFTRVQALNYRCLRHLDRGLAPFQVLVGPNASGKTTFLDVIGFLGHLVSRGLAEAIHARSRNFQDLVWRRAGNSFELAVEAAIPADLRAKLSNPEHQTVRYEVGIEWNSVTQEIGINTERVLFKASEMQEEFHRDYFPEVHSGPATILTVKNPKRTKTVISKIPNRNDNFYAETKKGYNPSFRLGPGKSALGNLTADEHTFPVCTWLKQLLAEGVQPVMLNSLLLRLSSPPGQGRRFKPDGSNLPWVVEQLRASSPQRFQDWVRHVRTALPDIKDVRVVELPDNKHAYLVLCYDNGIEVPSWMASDGTLRFLALTLPAYLPDVRGVFLIEEPENGIHPKAVEPVFQSLSSVYDAQVLLASHSPVVLSLVQPNQVLCFAKDLEGATDVVSGDHHPALKEWRGSPNFNVLFAAGVLG